MSSNNSQLSRETVSLLQHIELNKAGWWDKTIHRLVIAVVWIMNEPPNIEDIQWELKTTFKLSLSLSKLNSVLSSLKTQKMVIRLPSDTYRIAPEQRVLFEQDIATSEEVEIKAKETFFKLIAKVSEKLESDEVWNIFEHDFLAPLIKQVGANAYRLVAGEKMSIDESLADKFLTSFPPEFHTKLRTLVASFIDPKNKEVCAHISRMLHARFCVEASGLPEGVLEKLNSSIGKQIHFRMFVDTNFLFSLLELHENPSNDSAKELLDLISQLKGKPHIELVISPATIEEAKSSIAYTMAQLDGLPAGHNFSQAALQAKFSGMAIRFLTERIRRNGMLTPKDWFQPYLNNFLTIARNKDIEIFNEKLDRYSTRQDVVDDILVVREYEKKRPEYMRKSYQKIEHDIVLWHLVNDKRPAYIESPLDVKDWILTVDFRFIGFDEHKQKLSQSKVPICIHPTAFIQFLQFWVPRTKEFEEAMLGSLRLPFLFQEFDAEGEKTSLKILKGIGLFADSEELSQDTITHVMFNDALRSRLKTEQADETEIALIRDALVEEMKHLAEDEAQKAENLKKEILKRNSELSTLYEQKDEAERRNAQTKKEKEEAESLANQELAKQADEIAAMKAQLLKTEALANEKLSSQKAELATMNARLQEMEDAEYQRNIMKIEAQAKREQRKFLYTYLFYIVGVIFFTVLSAWEIVKILPGYAKILGTIPTMGFMAIITFVLGHLILEHSICRSPNIERLMIFQQLKLVRKILWGVVVLGFILGVGGNIYANYIQKNLDAERSSPPKTKSKASQPAPQHDTDIIDIKHDGPNTKKKPERRTRRFTLTPRTLVALTRQDSVAAQLTLIVMLLKTTGTAMSHKIGRNDLCPCESGINYLKYWLIAVLCW